MFHTHDRNDGISLVGDDRVAVGEWQRARLRAMCLACTRRRFVCWMPTVAGKSVSGHCQRTVQNTQSFGKLRVRRHQRRQEADDIAV